MYVKFGMSIVIYGWQCTFLYTVCETHPLDYPLSK